MWLLQIKHLPFIKFRILPHFVSRWDTNGANVINVNYGKRSAFVTSMKAPWNIENKSILQWKSHWKLSPFNRVWNLGIRWIKLWSDHGITQNYGSAYVTGIFSAYFVYLLFRKKSVGKIFEFLLAFYVCYFEQTISLLRHIVCADRSFVFEWRSSAFG